MITDLVEKCARAAAMAEDVPSTQIDSVWREYVDQALAVIDALADGVSQEMCGAFWHTFNTDWDGNESTRALSAAIRAAKSREG